MCSLGFGGKGILSLTMLDNNLSLESVPINNCACIIIMVYIVTSIFR